MQAQDRQAIIPEVQGLRGVTAVAVVLFHMGWLWCGWLGVWVFFTLSGFVITRSLLRTEAEGARVSALGFYRGRAARILPLYLSAVAVGSVVLGVQGWVLGRPEARSLLEQVPWLLTGTYNVYRAIPEALNTPLFGHLWSLSVEEQFYLLFPLIFLGLGRRPLVCLLVVAVAAGPVIRFATHAVLAALGWSTVEIATAVYMLTFNHLDAFALGILIALNEDRLRAQAGSQRARRLTWLIPGGLGLLAVVGIVLQNLQVPATGKDILTDAFAARPLLLSGQILIYSLAVLAAGGLLVLILTGSRLVVILASDALVRLGALSFGIYVWHFPLLWIFAEAGHRTFASAGLYLGATLAAAKLSYRYLEQPGRRWLEGVWRGPEVSPGRSPTSAARSPARP